MKIKILQDTQVRIGGKITPVSADEVYENLMPEDATKLIQYGMAELEEPAKIRILFEDALEGFRRNAVIEFKPRAAENLIRAGKAEIYNPEWTLPQEGESVRVRILYDTSIRGEAVLKNEIRLVKPSVATELLRVKAGTLADTGIERIKVRFLDSAIAAGRQFGAHAVAEIPADEAELLVKKYRAEF